MTDVVAEYETGIAQPSATKRKRPRILYVASTRHSGGLELASVRLAGMLMTAYPEGQEILYACRPDQFIDRQCRALGVETVPLVVRNSGDLSGVARLMQIVRRENIDIIHVHSRRDYVTATLAVALLRIGYRRNAPKLLLHMHLLRALGVPTLLSGYFFAPNVERFLAVSNAVRAFLLTTHRQLRPDQVTVVPNGIDIDRFQMDRARGAEIRQKHAIPEDAVVVGMVGRLDAKGQLEAVGAIGDLKRTNVYLLLVGDCEKQADMDNLKARAQEMGISGQIIFCGAQQDIVAHLNAMDIFAHLPLDEAFGLAPAEAMSTGLPVLVSNVGGCIELVEDGVTGLVVNPKDADRLSERFAELIDSPELRARLAAAGSTHVHSRYSTHAQAAVLTDIYSSVLQTGIPALTTR